MQKIVLLILFLPLFAAAGPQKFKPVTVPMEPQDRVVVRGYQGELKIVNTSSANLRVEASKGKSSGDFDRWNFQVRKKKNQVEIIVKGPSEQEDWSKVRAGKIPSFTLSISVPSRPLEVSWHKGNISLTNLNSLVTLQLTDGKITSDGGKGTLSAQLIKGAVNIKNHTGNIRLQTYKGTAVLRETKGVLILDNHSSRYQVTNHQGSAEVKNYSGPFAIEGMEGALTLFNRNGAINVTKHKGSIKGETHQGNLFVKALHIQDFIMKTDSGVVNLRLPKSSGAFVSLRSEKGGLQAYKYNNSLRKIRKGLWTELKGQLKGEEQGQIKIISKYGKIVLR